MIRLFRGTVLALMLTTSAGTAQDYKAGRTAYRAGDYAMAMQEWRPLAEQGNSKAQDMLGTLFQSGLGVPQDDVEAARWYRLAAKQGDAHGQLHLGFLYSSGLTDLINGVPVDVVPTDDAKAYMWLSLAASQGAAAALPMLELLEQSMSSADVSEAQSRAWLCLDSNYQTCD
jgi:TPR repeat protein